MLYAIDIISVQFQMANQKCTKIYVKSIYKKKTLASWNQTFMHLDTAHLVQPLWTPQLSYKHSKPFVVSTFNCSPYFYFDNGNRISGGVEFQLINTILGKYPKRFEMVQSEQIFLKWVLGAEAVANKSADLATCSHWFMAQNLTKVDTTYPLTQICVTFIVPKPRLLPAFTFIWQPFPAPVWALTLSMFVLVWFAILQTSRIYKGFKKDDFQIRKLRDNRIDTFLHLLRLMTLGGSNFMSRSSETALRLLFATWFLVCLVYSTYYSAGITSSLTNPRLTNTIKTIKDMVQYNVNWLEEPYLKKSFQKSHSQKLRKLGELGVPQKGSDVARIVKQLSNLYVTDTEDLDNYEKKHLMVLKECLGEFYIVFPIQKRSPFKVLFDKYYARFQEQGLISFWLRNITYFDNSHARFASMYSLYSDDLNHHNIDVDRFIGAIYLLLIGYLSAFVVFLYEYLASVLSKRANL
ncbi:hypothetical protein TcasGA2_TC008585 [Tribolium castaneum]|uniref:Ionotropic glutamate receptor C-terminal domain-containing protein n=1 Tax=Tribolium castaneum TaxID=7070 RepID=D7EIC8_TRICA|nr:hypothetical protein TcasGA2_TC008585 [Tribolium castaneum]